jgi:hypothetical protein
MPVAGLPDLLTIEEAARVIRVGRTKAYAMAREWRATGGRSGLPVIDFGHALRVPLCQLETIVGGSLTAERAGADAPATAVEHGVPQTADDSLLDASATTTSDGPASAVTAIPIPDPASTPVRSPRRPSRRRTPGPDQQTLPFSS